MGLGYLSWDGWRRPFRALADLAGVSGELTPIERVSVRPFRFFVATWIVWGVYALIKVFRGWDNLPANWPGTYLAILGVVYLLWRLAAERRTLDFLTTWLSESAAPAPQATRRQILTWLAGGFLLAAVNLALLEWRHPQTFTHDDNLSQFLPVILHGCRGLFDDGVFPTWNPHQFAGAPTASIGTYALTYPPTFASYAVARYVLGNEDYTMEVFGVLHLLAGYVTMFLSARAVGLRPSLAAAAGLCFALCGFFLIAGRSWFYMLPLATWLPPLAVSIWQMRSGALGWKWMIGTGVLLGVIFHAGNAQMWIYAVAYFGVAAVYLALFGGQSWRILVPTACAALLGAAIAAPLLLPQFLETAGLKRFAGGEPIGGGLFGLFLPWPLSYADRPGMAETKHLQFMTQFYYAGTVFTVVAAVAGLSCFFHRWPKSVVATNVLIAMALVAFVYALGRPGVAWGLTGELPVFKQFRHPMKYLAFVHLFGILGGGLILERFLRRTSMPRVEWGIAAACAVLMSYHTLLAIPSFCTWGFYPYPESPPIVQEIARSGQARLFPVSPRRSFAKTFPQSQMLNLPTVYGTFSLAGYDPLIEDNPQHKVVAQNLIDRPLESLRAYGIRHVVIFPTQDLPKKPKTHVFFRAYFWEDAERAVYQATLREGRLVRWFPGASLYAIDGAAPLAFLAGDEPEPVPIRFDAAGADVSPPANIEGRQLVVNVLPPRFLRVFADGAPLAYNTDEWGRLQVVLPEGTRRVRLAYSPCWLWGVGLGAFMAIAAVGGFARFGRAPPTR